MSLHTQTPWKQSIEPEFVIAGDGVDICRSTNVPDAAFIVRACNAHEDLLAVATLLLFRYDCDDIIQPGDAKIARDAIKKAKGI